MLGPRYSEGTNLSSDLPKLIPLLKDNPETMQIIFSIFHFRMDAISDQLEPKALFRLAIAIDKYDMKQALEVYTCDWLHCENIQNPERLWQLAKPSYLLHNDCAFEAATLGLLRYYGEPYLHLQNRDTTGIDIGYQFTGMSCSICCSKL